MIEENKPKEIELHTKTLLEKVEQQINQYHLQSLENLKNIKEDIEQSHQHFNKKIAKIEDYLHRM